MKNDPEQLSSVAGVAVIAGLSLALLFSGCGTSAGSKETDQAGTGINSLSYDAIYVKHAVGYTLSALDGITASAATEPRPAYETFSESVDDLEAAGKRAQQRAAEMKEKGAAYLEHWQKELDTVENAEIRDIAENRRAEIREHFVAIKEVAAEAKTTFPAFLSSVKDLRTRLGADLTVNGIKAAQTSINDAKDRGLSCQMAMDKLVDKLAAVKTALSAARVAPAAAQ